MFGRAVSPKDKEILKELNHHWRGQVKIARDVLSEPCIFFQWDGPWDIVYKLSQSGDYSGTKSRYVWEANRAIIAYCKQREQVKLKWKEEKEYQEKANQMQKTIATHGLKDTLPSE